MSETSNNKMFNYELKARNNGYNSITGVDEAGRGPLAGPVVAAAVILPQDFNGGDLNDSKQLTEAKREKWYKNLTETPEIFFGLGIVEPVQIDSMNILKATHFAMQLAIKDLKQDADFALVDGLAVPGLPVPAEFIVKGDSKSYSIAAASIIAKVYRDHYMVEMNDKYPGYSFDTHKGYGTKAHMQALDKLGPCPIHRMSYTPVKKAAGLLPEQLEFSFD